MNIEKLKTLLADKIGIENVIENTPMAEHTSFKTGGKAALLIKPQNIDDLRYTLFMLGKSDEKRCPEDNSNIKTCGHCVSTGSCNNKHNSKCNINCGSSCETEQCFNGPEITEYMVIGNGSNVLVKDGGYKGAIVKIGEAFSNISVNTSEGSITASPGALLSKIAKVAMENELTGFEFASGIPGSIGGAIFMNAGAYDGEMAHVVEFVKLISKDGTNERILFSKDLEFGYRHSIIQETEEIVTEVKLKLKKGNISDIKGKMKELAIKRNQKQPVHLPSAGSFFKRPTGYYAGALIEEAGLKGLSVGDAQVSPLHAGFIVNNGKATATEIIQLMHLVQETVKNQTGVILEPEVRIIGE